MFRAWQLGVTLAATLFMIAAISEGTPFFIAITSALLGMSILASDPPDPRTSLRGVVKRDRPKSAVPLFF
jgi:hypothetical protein